MPRWVVANEDTDGEESSEGEQEEEVEAQEDLEDVEDEAQEDALAGDEPGPSRPDGDGNDAAQPKAKRQKISLHPAGQGASLRCHVCGKTGHCAGFVGSVYMDCPNKPCYLCKRSGHTTMTCPYRMAPDHECKHATSGHGGILSHLYQRENDGKRRELNIPLPNYQVDAAVLKLHNRRCTCMQFHPTNDNLVVTGDKHGQLAIWNHAKVYERTVWKPNDVMTNNLAFLPGGEGMSCCCSSSDGTVKIFDLEVGSGTTVLNLQPGGWIDGHHNGNNWVMVYGLDASQSRNIIVGGDSHGVMHFIDVRSKSSIGSHQMHKKGNKVTCVHFSPTDPNLMLSSGNDWAARLSDLRTLSDSSSSAGGQFCPPTEITAMEHPKVVNSAFFSPVTGRKVLTTCIDNRIRIWDYLLNADKPADREIVHSHDFNRYLTPFRAEWDPKDVNERIFVCGRYISEDFGGQALHPIDVMDAQTGLLMLQLKDPNLPTITPVNKFHPRQDIIVSGSSRSLYAWKPVPQGEDLLAAMATGQATLGQGGDLQGSASYVFYDAAADQADDEKKKRKSKTTAETDEDTPKKTKTKVAAKSSEKVTSKAKIKVTVHKQEEKKPATKKKSKEKEDKSDQDGPKKKKK